jgi:hypothetical protein
MPPDTFESSRKRKLRETAEQGRDQQRRELARLELAYIEYKDQQLAAFIKKRWSGEELESLVEASGSNCSVSCKYLDSEYLNCWRPTLELAALSVQGLLTLDI